MGRRKPLRPAGLRDVLFLWRVRNDRDVREQSFSSERVALLTHLRWLRRTLADPSRRLYVAPGIGQVRLDEEAGVAEVSVAVRSRHRGTGAGTALIEEAVSLAGCPVVARIKRGNEASIRAFAKAGFRVSDDGEIVVMRHD